VFNGVNKGGNQQYAPQASVQQPKQQRTTMTYSMPFFAYVRIRMFWIITFFTLGCVSQFLLAVYLPDVWNYMYGIFSQNLPPL